MRRKQRSLFPVILAHIGITVLITIIGIGIDRNKEKLTISSSVIQEPSSKTRNLLEAPIKEDCIPRSIEEFPEDFFTLEEKQSGGVFVHIVIAFYLFAALAVVCDDYFVPSIDKICYYTKMKPDVAGATLMAGGSSAPELFTALIGVFITQTDVGVSTIVGSAVFNILCIIAICAVFARGVIYLSWWPLLRDTSYYCITVVLLIVTVYDSEVYWYEGLVYILMYVGYIIIMVFNERLERFFLRIFPEQRRTGNLRRITSPNEETHLITLSDTETTSIGHNSNRNTDDDDDDENLKELEENTNEDEEYESPFEIPESFFERVYWVAMVPMKVLFYITCPDCRRPGEYWKYTFPLTFLISVVWIAILSYVLVWMVCATGDAIGIPDTIMGLTILAAGTSIPDAMAGVIVAREGKGDMAISNSIGSNVFDILVCLGIPWFINALSSGTYVPINSAGITFTSISLLASVVFLIASLAICKWRLTKALGCVFFIVYVAFMTFSCLYEVNVFGTVNPPPCPRQRF